jgi:hypothetical protein
MLSGAGFDFLWTCDESEMIMRWSWYDRVDMKPCLIRAMTVKVLDWLEVWSSGKRAYWLGNVGYIPDSYIWSRSTWFRRHASSRFRTPYILLPRYWVIASHFVGIHHSHVATYRSSITSELQISSLSKLINSHFMEYCAPISLIVNLPSSHLKVNRLKRW